MNTYIPEGYKSLLGVYDTQKAIGLLKRLFEDQLAANLNLFRVSAPLFLEESSGLNDNLNGYERPVSFDILQTGREAQVVQSLAKWKRMALYRYDFYPGKGLYTDMNAIRRDEDVLDNLHSVYVDQWDWEKVIERRDRNLDYLKSTVMDIVAAVCETQRTMRAIYPQLQVLPELEQAARSRYDAEGKSMLQQYQLLQGREDDERSAWEAAMEAWQKEADSAAKRTQTAAQQDYDAWQDALKYYRDKANAEQKAADGKTYNTGAAAPAQRTESLSSAAAESLERAMGNYFRAGDSASAQSLLAQYSGRMTPAQKKRFAALFSRYDAEAGI